jgi:pyruvate formate lyase activating enzyme
MFVQKNCGDCMKCVQACPKQAASLKDGVWRVSESCDLCGECANSCYFDALTMEGRSVTVPELMKTLKKDANHYRRSGGGITLSGGEALNQPDFCAELLDACHAEGWNTAAETTAFISRSSLEKVLPKLDLVLLDIKHADSAKHLQYTRVSNERILDNARFIAEYPGCRLAIRVPVIPGFNATEREILDIAAIAESLPGVDTLHLLPFHRMGQNKYEHLQYEYLMDGVEPLPPETAMMLQKAVQDNTSLNCMIGG